MEVAEHLAIAEPQTGNFQDSLDPNLVQPDFKPQATDAGILSSGVDRTNRARTGKARVPHGPIATSTSRSPRSASCVPEIMRFREDHQGRAGGRTLARRRAMDLYQWPLMIPSHSQRHILRIPRSRRRPATRRRSHRATEVCHRGHREHRASFRGRRVIGTL